jgi:excisionase family DNA binding protein
MSTDDETTRTLLLTLAEAAEQLRMSEMSVRRLISDGSLQSVDVSTQSSTRSRTRVSRQALDDFIAERSSDRPRRRR